MRYEDGGHAASTKPCLHFSLHDRIECTRRLVQHDDSRITSQSACDRQTLQLATAEAAICRSGVMKVRSWSAEDRVFDAGIARSSLHCIIGNAFIPQCEIVTDRAREKHRGLWHISDVTGAYIAWYREARCSVERDVARPRAQFTNDEFRDSGLATSTRADEGNAASSFDLQGKILEQKISGVAIPEVDRVQ